MMVDGEACFSDFRVQFPSSSRLFFLGFRHKGLSKYKWIVLSVMRNAEKNNDEALMWKMYGQFLDGTQIEFRGWQLTWLLVCQFF